MNQHRSTGKWDLTPDQVRVSRRVTSIAFRVLLVCAAVFVLCLMFVAHLPRPALSVAMTVAEVVGMGAALVAIVGFFLDPRFRDFMDVDNPTYQRDRSE